MSRHSTETRPLKRKKTCDEEESSSDSDSLSSLSPAPASDSQPGNAPDVTLTRHVQYYFDDGNIVLSAADTIFRVHKGVLTLNSGFFQRALNQPREPDAEPVDGCPRITLQDSVAHIERLLEIMYRGGSTCVFSH